MEIYYDADALLSDADRIREIKTELTENMDHIAALVASIDGNWKGDSEAAFEARLLCVSREFSDLEQFFDDYADLLERFGREYKDCEDDHGVRIGGI